MDRKPARSRFVIGSAASLAALGAIHAPAKAAPVQWRMSYGDAKGSPRDIRMTQMADAITKESNGRVELKTYAANALGSQTGQLTQLRENSIQMVMTLNANYSSIVPLASLDSLGFIFTSQRQPCQALDGPLGAYIRQQIEAKGLHVFEKVIEGGFRQVSSSSHPIRNVDDFTGFKIRTPPAKIYVDLFKAFGASPVPVDAAELYTSLQTHVVDGQETPLEFIESYKIYEVQKYISMTNHIWTGYWITANQEAWNALSPDLQAIFARNATKYTLMEREDVYKLNNTIADTLKKQGMVFNNTDTSGMRPRLGSYYAYWKDQPGSTAWGLLEAAVGKLG